MSGVEARARAATKSLLPPSQQHQHQHQHQHQQRSWEGADIVRDGEETLLREWRNRVDQRLGTLEMSTGAVQAAIARMEASMPSRADVESAARTRLDVGTYTAAHQALVDRVTRLETGPQRLVAWISLLVSGGIGCLALLVSIAGVAIALIR